MKPGAPTLLFDGVCSLCNRTVQWVIRHDTKEIFRFAALQSEAGRRLRAEHDLQVAALDSVVLVDGDRAWVRSAAVFELVRRLGGGWSLLRVLLVVPRPIRDAAYDWVARNRYRWFGRSDECRLPTPDLRRRFLD